jgi:hypothetical protein
MKAPYHRICFVLALSATLAAPLRAADSVPTVDSIVEKFVAASGGKAALEKVTSRVIKGSLEAAGMPAATNWEMYAKAPNKQFSQAELTGMGTFTDGFDGAVAWAKNPFDGLRLKEGEELGKVKRDADFHRELNLKTLYPGLAFKGAEKLDGEEVHVLESKPSGSSLERFSFSVKSGLLVRQESEFTGPQGKISADIRSEDYRAVDGVNYPHALKIKMNAGGQEFEFSLKIIELRHNVPIEDAKFAKPAS